MDESGLERPPAGRPDEVREARRGGGRFESCPCKPSRRACPATTARAPLMDLLDRVGVAGTLDKAGIDIGGYGEGSYTFSTSAPPGRIITGRVFDFEDQDLTLNQIMLYAERKVDDSLVKHQF